MDEDETLDDSVGAVGDIHVVHAEGGGTLDVEWGEVVPGIVAIVGDCLLGRVKAGTEPELHAGSGIHCGNEVGGRLLMRVGTKAVSCEGERRGWSRR